MRDEKAKNDASEIIEDAKKKSAETKTNTESEIKLSGKQAINALKQQVVEIINGEVAKTAIDTAFDKDFTKKGIKLKTSGQTS